MGRVARIVAVIAVASVAVLGVATPASAHSQLEATAPATGTTVTTPLDQVTLTFNEPVRGKFSTVVVSDASGRSWSDGAVSVVDDDVHQAVYPLRSGAYTVAWRVVSSDGHPVSGEYHFSVSLPAALEPSSGPPSTPPAPKPAKRGFLWVVILALLLGAATYPMLRATRKLKESEAESAAARKPEPERPDQLVTENRDTRANRTNRENGTDREAPADRATSDDRETSETPEDREAAEERESPEHPEDRDDR